MSKVILEGYILVPNEDLKAVNEELVNHAALTLQEDGCLVFEVFQSAESLNKFSVYEEFTSQAAFEFHQARVKESTWGSVSKNAKRHYTITILE